MATVKVKFRASSVGTGEGTLVYKVTHRRVTRQITTGYRLYPQEWDGAHSKVVIPSDRDSRRQAYLKALEEKIADDMTLFRGIIALLDCTGGHYTADEVVGQYRIPPETGGFMCFARSLTTELKRTGRERTAERYTTVLNSFRRFLAERGDIPLNRIESALMVEYESHLKAEGICPNSSSFYMRGLRAVYNRAVEKGLTVQRNPFRHVYTGIDKTVKRAIPLKAVRQIRDQDLRLEPTMDWARDLFMFSFYTRGMSFIDMAYLKKSDLKNGVLSYRRQKTGQRLFIKWEKPMQEIVSRYDTSGTPYLLPVIRDMRTDERKQYKSAAHRVNRLLKKLGMRLGLAIPLTMYVARHGWASIAKSRNIPVSIISEAMGHDSEKTTLIYLASLDTSAIDKANSLILKAL
ncbi:site-specific integrase [Phocaeicola plebeius]|uniref:tyrosine-type recombinase/integrase n=1 Tax=Phocaeicola plebeius TaxID=310297 RepID=UPI002942F657|nr:site-specific integrase [Phocaeicola plebeius]